MKGSLLNVTFEGSRGGESGGVIMVEQSTFEKSMFEKSMFEKSVVERSMLKSKSVLKSKLGSKDGSKFMEGSSPRYGPLGMRLIAWSSPVNPMEGSGWTSGCPLGMQLDAWSNRMEESGSIRVSFGTELDSWSTSMKASYPRGCPLGPELDAPEFSILSPMSELSREPYSWRGRELVECSVGCFERCGCGPGCSRQ